MTVLRLTFGQNIMPETVMERLVWLRLRRAGPLLLLPLAKRFGHAFAETTAGRRPESWPVVRATFPGRDVIALFANVVPTSLQLSR
jgi:hypothetical protein